MSSPTYLVTGVTGNLGRAILTHLLNTFFIPASQIIVSTSSPTKAERFASLGVAVRIAHFDNKAALVEAFRGVDKLFFVSTDTINVPRRERQHKNVIDAAVEAGVGHTFYSSLAIGGSGPSNGAVMAAHLTTEKMLKESGATYTAVREGCYIEAFPFFLNWYPTDRAQKLYVPTDAKIAWAAIDELGEATAKLMIEGGHKDEIVLLSGPRAHSFSEIIDAVNKASNRTNTLHIIPLEEYAEKNAMNDEGGKSVEFLRLWGSAFPGLAKGEAEETSSLLGELLGRDPKDGVQWVFEELKRNPEYTWHQQYAGQGA